MSKWQRPAYAYLDKLGRAEAAQTDRGDRYVPSGYHLDLIELLNNDDEAGFKSLKDTLGYNSALGF